MKIYTRTGDKGTTGLLSGERISKAHPRPEACGTVDELNSVLGALVSGLGPAQAELASELQKIQSILFVAGSWLASTPGTPCRAALEPIPEDAHAELEQAIDRMTEKMPGLDGFILPGGHPTASWAHMARTVCRRAERRVVALADDNANGNGVLDGILVYLNRLSDYCFVLARYCNFTHGVRDIPREL